MSGGYRPSCVVNLTLRFDEAFTVKTADPPPVPAAIAAITEETNTVGAQSLVQSDGDSHILGRIPKHLNFELPGYRQCGKFSLTMDFRELPIDPRTVRACAIHIHTGVVTPEDFAAAFGDEQAPGLPAVLNTIDADNNQNAATLRMVGVVDDWEVEHNGSGSQITMSGRDLRGILLDMPLGADLETDEHQLDKIDWGKPINDVVAQILSLNQFFHIIRVKVNPADWPNGELPSPTRLGFTSRFQQGARGKKSKEAFAPALKPAGKGHALKFWDLIVNACYLVGAIPYFQGTELVIRPSASIYDKLRGPVDPQRNPTPFKGGKARSVDALTGQSINLLYRKLVYGRDVEMLRMGRKFAGWRKPTAVRCISMDIKAETSADSSLRHLRVGTWPPNLAEKEVKDALNPKATDAAAGSKGTQTKVLTIPVHAVKDPAQLELIARSIYEEIGRGEIGGEASTYNLASFGGDYTDPDLLRLQPGDGIQLQVDTQAVRSGVAPLISSYTTHARQSFEAQVREVNARLGDANLARVIVATARGAVNELQSFFRVQNVKYTWDEGSGFKIDFDFQNYVVARAQIGEASADPGKPKVTTAGKAGSTGGGNPGSMGNL